MSQERVLTLLYDKTFPPRSQSVGFTGQLGTNFGNTGMSRAGTQSANKIGLKQVDSMHQFNYFGSTPGGNMAVNAFDEDVELLEREIETVMMRKGNTAVGGKRDRLNNQNGIVNMTTQGFEQGRTQTAGL